MKKTVLITGASGGIGSACARIFALNDYFVAINYYKNKKNALLLFDEIKKFGGVAQLVYGNVCSPFDVDKIYEKLKKSFGLPGVLINNAGISLNKLFTETTFAELREIFNVNFNATFLCCKKFVPNMIKHKWGRVINVSSIWGVVGASCEVVYSASKAAVIGFSKALSKELAPSNITVNCLAPGLIDTDMNKNLSEHDIKFFEQQLPARRSGDGFDVAKAALFFASESSGYVTGQVLRVDGGFV